VLLSCCASKLRWNPANVTALKFERLKVTLATCFPKIYQTDTKIFAKEQDAARQTHASPSYDLNAANGVPNDAD